jgi:hypothetical protein
MKPTPTYARLMTLGVEKLAAPIMVMASREKMCKTLSDKNPPENSFNFITDKV